jgi:hypothetical protein
MKTVQGGTKKIPIINSGLTSDALTSAINDRLRRASGLQTKGKLKPGNALTIDSNGFIVDTGVPVKASNSASGAGTGTGGGISVNGVSYFITINSGALASNLTINGH